MNLYQQGKDIVLGVRKCATWGKCLDLFDSWNVFTWLCLLCHKRLIMVTYTFTSPKIILWTEEECVSKDTLKLSRLYLGALLLFSLCIRNKGKCWLPCGDSASLNRVSLLHPSSPLPIKNPDLLLKFSKAPCVVRFEQTWSSRFDLNIVSILKPVMWVYHKERWFSPHPPSPGPRYVGSNRIPGRKREPEMDPQALGLCRDKAGCK